MIAVVKACQCKTYVKLILYFESHDLLPQLEGRGNSAVGVIRTHKSPELPDLAQRPHCCHLVHSEPELATRYHF